MFDTEIRLRIICVYFFLKPYLSDLKNHNAVFLLFTRILYLISTENMAFLMNKNRIYKRST